MQNFYVLKDNYFPIERKKKNFFYFIFKNSASYSLDSQKTRNLFTAIRNQETIFSLNYDFNLNAKLLNSNIFNIKKKLRKLGFDGVVIIDLYSLPVLDEEFAFRQYNITSNIVLNEIDVKNIDKNKISFPIYTNSKKNSENYKEILDISIEQLADILSSYINDSLEDYYTIQEPKRFILEFKNFNLLEVKNIEGLLKSIHGYKRIRSQVLGNNYKVFYFSSLSFNRLYNNLTTLMENNNIAFRINNKSSLQIIFSKKNN